jgi:hypothetical protein
MLQLFSDEKLLTQSLDGGVTLTTHRIVYEYKDWRRSYNQSIMLEHITSCENAYKTQVWSLILSGLCFVVGLIEATNNHIEQFGSATLVAIAFAAFFWFTKSNLMIIASPSTKMIINVKGMKRDRVLEFLNNVEQAKHKRLLTLNNRPSNVF